MAPRLEVNHPMRPTPGPRLVTVLVSGAEGGSAPRRTFGGYASPAPSRCALLYTSRTAPGAGVGNSHPSKRRNETMDMIYKRGEVYLIIGQESRFSAEIQGVS